MRFIEISIGGAPSQSSAGSRERPFILPLRGFGARIRQRQALVTRLSCLLAVFGEL
jgi:hypothetical protein